MSDANWELFHRYRKLVEQEVVRPVRCPDDDTVMVTRLGSDDEPVLWCMTCLSTLKPGLDLLQQIRAVVSEHYV